MGVIKKIKKKVATKRREQQREMLVRYGLILLGFNIALSLALFFGLVALTVAILLLPISITTGLLLPLLAVFFFAGACAIVWYRFGQILGDVFPKNRGTSVGVVVLISIIPLLLLLFFLALILSTGFGSITMTLAFLGTTLLTVLAVIFELFIVLLGAVTGK